MAEARCPKCGQWYVTARRSDLPPYKVVLMPCPFCGWRRPDKMGKDGE